MLFWHEFRKTVCGTAYLLFVTVIVIALNSQGVLDFQNEIVTEPNPSASQNYGTKYEENPAVIMPAALQSLYAEFRENKYQTYPVGFVKLDDDKQQKIAEILSELSGENPDNASELSVRTDISYAKFKALMQTADDILGGGSDYAAKSLIHYGRVPVTYEEAAKRYELVKTYDQFTGGYARLFCDYAAAMALSILPVFPAVIMSMRDRRAKMSELIYIRATPAAKLLLMRYLAVTAAVMLPVLILSYGSNSSI